MKSGGMIELLSDHLYSSPDVYLRELLKNRNVYRQCHRP